MAKDETKAAEKAAYDTGVAGLPENAFRELAADEEYRPVMHPALFAWGCCLPLFSVQQQPTLVCA